MTEPCNSVWNMKRDGTIETAICELETGHHGRHRRTDGEVMYQWPRLNNR